MHASDLMGRMTHVPDKVAHDDRFRKLARFGFATKGTLYVIIGVLAMQAAFAGGGAPKGSKGAIAEIAQQPFGTFLVGLVMVGLAAYAVWRGIQAFMLARRGRANVDSAKVWMKTAACAVSAVVHGLLAVWAGSIVFGTASSSSGGNEQTWSARLMSEPGGRFVLGVIGVVLIGYGIVQAGQAIKETFLRRFRTNEMSAKERKVLRGVGKAGLLARGFVFALMGGFVIQAVVRSNPNEVKGLGGALSSLATQPYGPWLLGLTGLGLLAYGVYGFFQARYRPLAV